jgi:hypothetical protein
MKLATKSFERESLICAKRACARAHSNLRAITCAPYTLMCALFKIARAQNFLYSARVWTSLKIYTHRTLMRILFSYDIFSRAHIRLNNLLVTLCYGLQTHSYFAQKNEKLVAIKWAICLSTFLSKMIAVCPPIWTIYLQIVIFIPLFQKLN